MFYIHHERQGVIATFRFRDHAELFVAAESCVTNDRLIIKEGKSQ